MVVMSPLPGAAGLLTPLGRTEGDQPVRGSASQGHTKDRVPALRAHDVQTAQEPKATGWPCRTRLRHVCHPLVPRMLFQTEPESILTAARLDRGQRQPLLQTGSSGESRACPGSHCSCPLMGASWLPGPLGLRVSRLHSASPLSKFCQEAEHVA